MEASERQGDMGSADQQKTWLLTLWLLASHLIPLKLTFLIYKGRTLITNDGTYTKAFALLSGKDYAKVHSCYHI